MHLLIGIAVAVVAIALLRLLSRRRRPQRTDRRYWKSKMIRRTAGAARGACPECGLARGLCRRRTRRAEHWEGMHGKQ